MKSTMRHTAAVVCLLFSLLAANAAAQVTWSRDPANPVLDMYTGSEKDPNAYYRLYTVSVYADDTSAIPYRMWFGSRSAAGRPARSAPAVATLKPSMLTGT